MGNLILSLAVAFGGHMLIEAPFMNLERLLFANARPSSKDSPANILCQVRTTQDIVEGAKDIQGTQDRTRCKSVP